MRSEQARYEAYTRQRNLVLGKYRKVIQAFNELIAGFIRAQSFYSEMKDTAESLDKNVETFVNNRRSEGAQLLSHIERDRATSIGGQADRERDRLRELMERMSVDPSSSSPTKITPQPSPLSRTQTNDHYSSKTPPMSPPYVPTLSRPNNNMPPLHTQALKPVHSGNSQYASSPDGNHQHMHHHQKNQDSYPHGANALIGEAYNPMAYPFQTSASMPPPPGHTYSNPTPYGYPQHSQHSQYLPQGYVPPPPPPGPPPNAQPNFGNLSMPYPSGAGGLNPHQASLHGNGSAQQGSNDPWAGLNAWK